ncbi:MAG: copper resistance protein CopC [Chloroflexi bacterium]|nr:copper resistance protein CopC [Chloroflexota bacterium]
MTRTLRVLPLAIAGLLMAASPAAAHAELVSVEPAADEELEAPPDTVVLVFSGELDAEASSFVVTDADGVEVGRGGVDLEVAERSEMRGAVEIDGPGTYTVEWSVVAADGHAAEGAYAFVVAGEGGEPAAAPDTALPAPATSPLQLLGLILLGGAAATLRRTGMANR